MQEPLRYLLGEELYYLLSYSRLVGNPEVIQKRVSGRCRAYVSIRADLREADFWTFVGGRYPRSKLRRYARSSPGLVVYCAAFALW
jgi:hypothetical protein